MMCFTSSPPGSRTVTGSLALKTSTCNGLLKNRHLSRSFSDAALGKLIDMLTSKIEQRGGQVIKVGRFFPGSQDLSCMRMEVGRDAVV